MASESDIEAKVKAAMDSVGVKYELIRINPDFADTAQFCQEYGFPIESCGNTIIIASTRGEKKFCACVVKGSNRLDVNKTVKNLMGVPRASFASPDETKELTGMLIGGVTAFALPDGLPVYVDAELLNADYVILGSGSRSSKLKLPPSELRKIPNSQIITGLSFRREP
ncbi:MAG: hypothetical protein L0177_12400 [Chloroflexi bacterium]|nr:hypothetical protein [Chloroflexota bacterium]